MKANACICLKSVNFKICWSDVENNQPTNLKTKDCEQKLVLWRGGGGGERKLLGEKCGQESLPNIEGAGRALGPLVKGAKGGTQIILQEGEGQKGAEKEKWGKCLNQS